MNKRDITNLQEAYNRTKQDKVIKVDNYTDIPNNFTGVAEYPDGGKWWRLNGELHREDGPAVEYVDGSKEWWLNGKLHREGGPAYESADGHKEWYLNGERYTEDKYWQEIVKRNPELINDPEIFSKVL